MSVPSNVVQSPGVSVITADSLNTYVQVSTTASALRGFAGTSNMCVLLMGIGAVNDGNGGFFYWNPAAGFTDNNSSVIVPTGSGAGAWIKLGAL